MIVSNLTSQLWIHVQDSTRGPACPDCSREMILIGSAAYCEQCRCQFKKQKNPVKHKPLIDLTMKDVAGMLTIAGEESVRDFSILAFLASSFRESEVVGGDGKIVKLPGIQIEDIRLAKEAVWVSGKGQTREIDLPVPKRFLEAALYLADGAKTGRIPWGIKIRRVNDLVWKYACAIEHPDAKHVRPHRFRAWFSEAAKKVIPSSPVGMVEWIDLMRHSRKSSGVTIGHYGGSFTTFERRHEIAVTALQPLLQALPSKFQFEQA